MCHIIENTRLAGGADATFLEDCLWSYRIRTGNIIQSSRGFQSNFQ